MSARYSDGRRRFLGATAATTAATMLGVPSPTATAAPTRRGESRKCDLALFNGRIHTLDRKDTVVDKLLIKDGRFAEVGSMREVGDAEVVNLRGRTVIPGIID